jgi:hypothetical protein
VFKNKGFLYGLGLGMILGATLLQLMNFSGVNQTITKVSPSASPTSSISPSSAPDQSPTTKTTIDPVESIKPTQTTVKPDTPNITAVPAPVVSKTEEPAVPKTEDTQIDEPVKPTPVATVTDPSAINIIIERGMTSSEVASLLFNKGIIADRKSFDESLSHLKLDRIIRIGTFTFLPGQEDSDIINQITTHK